MPESSKSPRRRSRKHHTPKKAASRRHCCQQCASDLQISDSTLLPTINVGPIVLTRQIGKEDTFTNVIDW